MYDFEKLMEPDYVQMFDLDLNVELNNDIVCQGQKNIRKQFLKTIYLFFTIELIIVMMLGAIPAYLTEFKIFNPICWACIAFNQLLQFYFQYHGKIDLGENRKLYHYTIGSLSIIFNSFSYFYIFRFIDTSYPNYSNWLGIYVSASMTVIQLLATVLVLMLICQFTQTSLRSSSAWIVPLLIPYFIQLIYIPFKRITIRFDRLSQYTQIISWLGIIILLMTQEMKTKQENYEAMFINSCRLLGAPFQILVYVFQFVSQSRRDDTWVYKATEYQKILYLRKIATSLSIITLHLIILILLLVQTSQISSEIIPNEDKVIIKLDSTLILALLQDGLTFTPLFWVSVSLSIVFYILIIVIKNYHWIIVWTLFILQITFYSFCLLGVAWYLAIENQSEGQLYLIGVSLCIFNGTVKMTFFMRDSVDSMGKVLFQLQSCGQYKTKADFMNNYMQKFVDQKKKGADYELTTIYTSTFEARRRALKDQLNNPNRMKYY